MIEGITLGQIAVLVAFVVALVKGIDTIIGWFKKPTDNLESKIDKRLEAMEKDSKMSLKILYSMLQHEVTGDHVNDMEKLYNELSTYIIDK